jgi:LCP family protein required for cell wall assembly
MTRINTAYAYGEMDNTGTGADVLLQTIRESLGLEVDYWARVDFADFRHLIDDLGGVDIVVDCAIEDWRLKEPGLDPTLEESWAQFTLPVGVHTMDGDLALWYARSRRTSSDFDRGRRHQALIQAVWRRVRDLGLDTQLTAVWPQLLDLVDTNLPLDRVLELVPLGVSLSPSRIAHFTLRSGQEVMSWRSPEGASVLAPNREALERTIRQFLTPPTANQLRANPVSAEIVNATGVRGMDAVAAWRLGWEGVHVIIGEPAARSLPATQVFNLTGQTKGDSSSLLTNALNVGPSSVRVEPNTERSTDYRIFIGQDYYPCTYNVTPPSS